MKSKDNCSALNGALPKPDKFPVIFRLALAASWNSNCRMASVPLFKRPFKRMELIGKVCQVIFTPLMSKIVFAVSNAGYFFISCCRSVGKVNSGMRAVFSVGLK